MDLLTPDSGTLFWTVVTFVLLMLILKKFAWKPILKTLDDRENKIKVALYQAEQDQKEAEKLLTEQKAILDKAKKESAQIINESKKNAEAARTDLIEHARTEADNLLERAKQEIESSKVAAIEEVKKYTTDIAVLAAQKVVGETLSKIQHVDLIEKYIKQLSQTK